jgi:hypothetical protein
MNPAVFTIQIRKLSPNAMAVPELHTQVWKSTLAAIHERLTDPANGYTIEEYLADEAREGFVGNLRWHHSDTALQFQFRDFGGCCDFSRNVRW